MKLNKMKLKTTEIFTFGEDENYKNYKLSEIFKLIKKQVDQLDHAQKLHKGNGDSVTFGEEWSLDALKKLLDCIED